MKKIAMFTICALLCTDALAFNREISLKFQNCTKTDVNIEWQGNNFCIGDSCGLGRLSVEHNSTATFYTTTDLAIIGSRRLKMSSNTKKLEGGFTMKYSIWDGTLNVINVQGPFTFDKDTINIDDYGNNLFTVYIGCSSHTGGLK